MCSLVEEAWPSMEEVLLCRVQTAAQRHRVWSQVPDPSNTPRTAQERPRTTDWTILEWPSDHVEHVEGAGTSGAGTLQTQDGRSGVLLKSGPKYQRSDLSGSSLNNRTWGNHPFCQGHFHFVKNRSGRNQNICTFSLLVSSYFCNAFYFLTKIINVCLEHLSSSPQWWD